MIWKVDLLSFRLIKTIKTVLQVYLLQIMDLSQLRWFSEKLPPKDRQEILK
jgi:hypothetical protein